MRMVGMRPEAMIVAGDDTDEVDVERERQIRQLSISENVFLRNHRVSNTITFYQHPNRLRHIMV